MPHNKQYMITSHVTQSIEISHISDIQNSKITLILWEDSIRTGCMWSIWHSLSAPQFYESIKYGSFWVSKQTKNVIKTLLE